MIERIGDTDVVHGLDGTICPAPTPRRFIRSVLERLDADMEAEYRHLTERGMPAGEAMAEVQLRFAWSRQRLASGLADEMARLPVPPLVLTREQAEEWGLPIKPKGDAT